MPKKNSSRHTGIKCKLLNWLFSSMDFSITLNELFVLRCKCGNEFLSAKWESALGQAIAETYRGMISTLVIVPNTYTKEKHMTKDLKKTCDLNSAIKIKCN